MRILKTLFAQGSKSAKMKGIRTLETFLSSMKLGIAHLA